MKRNYPAPQKLSGLLETIGKRHCSCVLTENNRNSAIPGIPAQTDTFVTQTLLKRTHPSHKHCSNVQRRGHKQCTNGHSRHINSAQTDTNSAQTDINSVQTDTNSTQTDTLGAQTAHNRTHPSHKQCTNGHKQRTNGHSSHTQSAQTDTNSAQTDTNSAPTDTNSAPTYTSYTSGEQTAHKWTHESHKQVTNTQGMHGTNSFQKFRMFRNLLKMAQISQNIWKITESWHSQFKHGEISEKTACTCKYFFFSVLTTFCFRFGSNTATAENGIVNISILIIYTQISFQFCKLPVPGTGLYHRKQYCNNYILKLINIIYFQQQFICTSIYTRF